MVKCFFKKMPAISPSRYRRNRNTQLFILFIFHCPYYWCCCCIRGSTLSFSLTHRLACISFLRANRIFFFFFHFGPFPFLRPMSDYTTFYLPANWITFFVFIIYVFISSLRLSFSFIQIAILAIIYVR